IVVNGRSRSGDLFNVGSSTSRRQRAFSVSLSVVRAFICLCIIAGYAVRAARLEGGRKEQLPGGPSWELSGCAGEPTAYGGGRAQTTYTLIFVAPSAAPGLRKFTFQLSVSVAGNEAVNTRLVAGGSSKPPPRTCLPAGHVAAAGMLVTNAPIAP